MLSSFLCRVTLILIKTSNPDEEGCFPVRSHSRNPLNLLLFIRHHGNTPSTRSRTWKSTIGYPRPCDCCCTSHSGDPHHSCTDTRIRLNVHTRHTQLVTPLNLITSSTWSTGGEGLLNSWTISLTTLARGTGTPSSPHSPSLVFAF